MLQFPKLDKDNIRYLSLVNCGFVTFYDAGPKDYPLLKYL